MGCILNKKTSISAITCIYIACNIKLLRDTLSCEQKGLRNKKKIIKNRKFQISKEVED